jgi:succinate dehydrogenase / fumarate reductase flavoprotein subunit
MSNIPGLYVLGEANFSDHGANRLGASALMQGLADGYFVLPATIGDYFAKEKFEKVSIDRPEVKKVEQDVNDLIKKFLSINGQRTPDSFHKQLGKIIWDKCGMARNKKGLEQAIQEIKAIREEFWKNLKVVGTAEGLNQSLEKAGRVADFIELGEMMCYDALTREESCGGHFREEHQTEDGEALRHDDKFLHAAVWEYKGPNIAPERHIEPLVYENIKLATRSYK